MRAGSYTAAAACQAGAVCSGPGDGRRTHTCLLTANVRSLYNSVMKRCGRCERWLAVDAFTPNRSRRDGLQAYCQECQRAYMRAHYEANREYYLAKARRSNARRYESFRKQLWELKSGPRQDCGLQYPPWSCSSITCAAISSSTSALRGASRSTRCSAKLQNVRSSARIVTTTGRSGDPRAHSSVWIERHATDVKAGGSSPSGRATFDRSCRPLLTVPPTAQ